jgi:chromosome segregation ATPase
MMPRNKHLPLTENSVNPHSSEPDVEPVPSNHSDDTTSLNGEHTMSKKFDFDSLVAAEKQQSLDDLAEDQEVLREIARYECNRPEAEILRLLERCDRDTGDLKSDVQWRGKRDEQIAEVRRDAEYRTKNDELLAKLRSMREEFKKLEAEYEAKRKPLCRESDALDEKLRSIERFRHDLYESCRDNNLKLELQVLESSFTAEHRIEIELFERQRAIRSEISQREYEREDLPITIDRNERKKNLKQRIRQLQEEWEQLEAKKGEIEQKKVEHKQAVAAIRERMIFS